MALRTLADLIEKPLMQRAIAGRIMVSQESPGPHRIRHRPGNCIVFMVAEDALRSTRLDHAAHQLDCRQLLRSAIDQISDENRGALGMPPNSTRLRITEAR